MFKSEIIVNNLKENSSFNLDLDYINKSTVSLVREYLARKVGWNWIKLISFLEMFRILKKKLLLKIRDLEIH